MLRDKSLIPLSRQHQHVLALCVRIDRAQPIPARDLPAWQTELEQIFANEVKVHFAAEEEVLFPIARRFPELVSLVEDLTADHAWLRVAFSEAQSGRVSAESLSAFGQGFSAHIRKEERQLFERLQELMNAEQLADLGKRLEKALENAVQACAVNNLVGPTMQPR
jgi:hemerythrin-like domain-containing protein